MCQSEISGEKLMYCSTDQRILLDRGNRYGTSIVFILSHYSLINNAYAKCTSRKTRNSRIYGQKHYRVVYFVSAQIEDPETCAE